MINTVMKLISMKLIPAHVGFRQQQPVATACNERPQSRRTDPLLIYSLQFRSAFLVDHASVTENNLTVLIVVQMRHATACVKNLSNKTSNKTENDEQTGEGSGSGMLRVVVERLEEVFVRDFDVGHPLEQVVSLAIGYCVPDEGTRGGHVRRALRYHVAVRRRRLSNACYRVIAPPILEPPRIELAAVHRQRIVTATHHNRFTARFPGPPG